MSQRHIKCIKINNEEDFCTFVKQFSISSILKSSYKISREIYVNGCSIEYIHRQIIVKDDKSGQVFKYKVLIQPWQFPDLIYKSIMYSNDYRGLTDLTENIFLLVLLETNEYVSSTTNELIKEIHSSLDASLFMYGFGGEQFKYQTQISFYQNLIRELYIIFSLTKKHSSIVNPEEIVKQEIGVEWKDLILVLYGIFIDSLFHQNINEAIKFITFDSGKNKGEIFNKVIDYYSVDYDSIRNNNSLGRQIFYVKPFIRTQRGELLTASVYFNQFIVEHAAFWIIRNYFMNKPKKERQTFTDEFGRLFEYYLEDLFKSYQIDYKKIPEEKKKERADWHLKIGKYNILIEQKSSILPINIKQQLTDFIVYKKELHKIIYKALQQLKKTEEDLSINKPIKIILCYDNYINANILPHVFEETDCPVNNDGRYFVSNIMEIEMLIELASMNYNLFEIVIKDMLRRNMDGNGDEGMSLLIIMRDNGYANNSYWTSPIFDDYKNFLRDIKNKHEFFRNKM